MLGNNCDNFPHETLQLWAAPRLGKRNLFSLHRQIDISTFSTHTYVHRLYVVASRANVVQDISIFVDVCKYNGWPSALASNVLTQFPQRASKSKNYPGDTFLSRKLVRLTYRWSTPSSPWKQLFQSSYHSAW